MLFMASAFRCCRLACDYFRNTWVLTPSPACGPKPKTFLVLLYPFGGRRPVPPRLVKAPVAVHPLPQRGEGSKFKLPLPSPLWGRGAGGEGVALGTVSANEQH